MRTGTAIDDPQGGDPPAATVGFLHTAASHVDRFAALLSRLDPAATGAHVVREDLLARAREAQQRAPGPLPHPSRERDAVRAALAAAVTALADGCGAVLVTCSTLGPYVESLPAPVVAGRVRPLIRIDRPLATAATRLAVARAAEGARSGRPRWPSTTPYVVVVAALDSALAPARVLLAECAAVAGHDLGVGGVVAAGAWRAFEAGDVRRYQESVAGAIRAAARLTPDVIVLAQASMAELADPAGDRYGVPVLASPELAVAEALRRAGS